MTAARYRAGMKPAAHYLRFARSLALGAAVTSCAAARAADTTEGSLSEAVTKQRGSIPSGTVECRHRQRPSGACTPLPRARACYAFSGPVRFACACLEGRWQCRRDVPTDFLGPLPPPELPA